MKRYHSMTNTKDLNKIVKKHYLAQRFKEDSEETVNQRMFEGGVRTNVKPGKQNIVWNRDTQHCIYRSVENFS